MEFSGFEDILAEVNNTQEQQDDVNKRNERHNKNVVEKIDINKLQQEVFSQAETQKTNKLKVIKNDIHSGHRQRARERFLNNPETTSDYDLLELLLFLIIPRADTKPIAKKLIDKYKTLRNLFNASIMELNNDGINGNALKYIFLLINTTQKRLLNEEMKEQKIIDNYKLLIKYCQSSIGAMKEEQFRVLFFNNKFKLLEDVVFGSGEISFSTISCKEIVKKSLEIKAENVVLYHNHPNQDLSPSLDDISTTKAIVDALSPININVLDHIIISGNKYFSFKEEGLL